MNASSTQLYTNEVTPEFLRTLDDSLLKKRQLASLDEQVLTRINQQQAYAKAHPPIAIYRIATEGSQTRNGGVIQQATSPMTFMLDDGQEVRAAQKDDYVAYADGSQAQIVTTSGEDNSHVALVGSALSNGDEIINTPQDGALFVRRDGVPMAEDFLPCIEG
jgi:hypothetical protein